MEWISLVFGEQRKERNKGEKGEGEKRYQDSLALNVPIVVPFTNNDERDLGCNSQFLTDL